MRVLSTILCVFIVFAAVISFAGEIPSDVLARIKQKAAQDFPNDYSTQKYVIDTQKQAYIQVRNYSNARIPKNILTQIKRKASQDFPNGYTTQKYIIDTQVKAYLELQ